MRRRLLHLSVAAAAALLLVGSAQGRAGAADRPSEEDMFGGGPARPAPPGTPDGGVSPGVPAAGEVPPGAAAPGAAPGAPTGTPAGSPAGSPPGSPAGSPAGPPLPAGVPPAAAASHPAAPGDSAPLPPPDVPPPVPSASSRDAELLGDPSAGPRFSMETAPEDPLKIGGQLYLRAAYTRPGAPIFDFTGQTVTSRPVTFSAPSLVDAYFDARPNERVRGFVLGRMFFDPSRPSAAQTTMPGMDPGTDNMGISPTTPLLSGTANTRGPSVALDQLWLRFDLGRTIFVTAGRQHVKWGTARFWTPTDYLHPVRRNPVAVFDARPGFTMLKLHLPLEDRGWNFYGFALVEGVRRWDKGTGSYSTGRDATETLGQIGGAARAELVFGPAELGLDLVGYQNQKPRYGADLSFGIGDFDLYVNAGFQYGSEIPRVDADRVISYPSGIKPQVTGGGSYSRKYNDNDVFTLAGEYFYNSRGYNDPRVYPALFATGTFEFFYTGRHYAALSAILAAPWSWNYTNFTFTTLGNLSDQSFISRLDYSHTMLTHLTLEAFAAVNYGRREGEFRLGVDNIMIGNQTLSLQPQSFSLGLGLRIKI